MHNSVRLFAYDKIPWYYGIWTSIPDAHTARVLGMQEIFKGTELDCRDKLAEIKNKEKNSHLPDFYD